MATCGHYYDRLKWIKYTIINLEKVKKDYETMAPQIESAISILDSFSSSLLYICYYLENVIINDLPFDKGECKRQADKVDEFVELLKTMLDECNTKLEETDTKITEQQANYDALAAEPCEQCAAEAAAAAASSSSPSSSGSNTQRSGGGGGGTRRNVTR